ncbi:Glutaredoxin domain-containing protein [Heracleum sosnowskyi]|uniref:Glutaredoxin domain-containing protein n=1 Tax=Heracleum sosnowskyi TaxID=360622 RepID=A0AAD8HYF3_9APIA|nr:Glutaredoxin domain-containing protein [Heracleum sosnowskyi]
MHGLHISRRLHDGDVRLELTPTTSSLAIDVLESPEMRIHRLIFENPVVIFTRSSTCCMCHVMKQLLSKIGVHPTVIELEDDEIAAAGEDAPAVFIGGTRVGGFESLVALHLGGHLVPKLIEIGALRTMNRMMMMVL